MVPAHRCLANSGDSDRLAAAPYDKKQTKTKSVNRIEWCKPSNKQRGVIDSQLARNHQILRRMKTTCSTPTAALLPDYEPLGGATKVLDRATEAGVRGAITVATTVERHTVGQVGRIGRSSLAHRRGAPSVCRSAQALEISKPSLNDQNAHLANSLDQHYAKPAQHIQIASLEGQLSSFPAGDKVWRNRRDSPQSHRRINPQTERFRNSCRPVRLPLLHRNASGRLATCWTLELGSHSLAW